MVHVDDGRLEDKRSTSSMGTLANMLKGFIGSGIIGLPFAIKESGLIAGVVSLCFLGVLSLYCITLLLKCLEPSNDKNFGIQGLDDVVSESKPLLKHNTSPRKSYEEIGEAAFGRPGRIFVQATLIFTQMGFCCVYVIFLGQNMFEIITGQLPSSSHLWMAYALIFLPLLIGVCLLKKLKFLVPFSLLGQITIFGGLGVIFVYAIVSIFQNGVGNHTEIHQYEIGSYPIFFGTAAYVFEGIGIIIPLQRAIMKPEKFPTVLNVNFLIVSIAYIGFGVIGYLAYGQATASPITANLPHNVFSKIITATLIVAIFCTYPIQMVPVIQIAENGLFDSSTLNLELKRNLLRISLVFVTFASAYAIPHFDLFISLVGALGCSLLAFILPTAFHMKLIRVGVLRFILHIVIVIVGFVAMVVSTTVTIQQIVSISK